MGKKNSILESVHETAKGLSDAGVMDAQTTREFDALCLPPVKMLTSSEIKALRIRLKTSQGVFAIYLNTSKSTVQKWERGEKKPSGSSMKLLNIVKNKGLEVLT